MTFRQGMGEMSENVKSIVREDPNSVDFHVSQFIWALVILVTISYYRIIYITLVTLPRDYKFVVRWSKLILRTRNFERNNVTVVSLFQENARNHPDKPIFYHEDSVWTFSDVQKYANKISDIFETAGLQHGDVVALCMESRIEYVAIWLGLAQLGVIIALINTNLRHQPLIHSITIVKPKAAIFSSGLRQAFVEIRDELSDCIDLYQLGRGESNDTTNTIDLCSLLEAACPENVARQTLKNKDLLFYIYTSGTTGMPKAARVPHARYLIVTLATTTIISLNEKDKIYNPLPLYHSAGGIIGIGPALVERIPAVIKTKFSASTYFSDCARYKCTIGQYIGEMCRYILAVPAKPDDGQHGLRMIIGNGLNTWIWREFVARFKVPQVTELYGATEGNVNIVNLDSTVGAVGFLPRFLPKSIAGIGIIKVDAEGVPLRDANGLCIGADIDEPGMFVGIISSKNASREYHGYVDQDATVSKVIENVFRQGDKAFVSGDTMTMDKFGYLYFKDRTGDTYRWKGENVATAEVESAISKVADLKDATVYGVQVPGQEGRAGMAAIADPENRLDIAKLADGLDRILPPYARPLFLRLINKIDMTGTYRLKKVDLQREGFDPKAVRDRLYFRSGKNFEVLTEQLYHDIVSGRTRI